MPYTKQIDRRSPGCFIFLLDQSDSMNYPISGRPGVSKAQALADIINDTLAMIIRRCSKERGEGPRPYYDIAVIGYSGEEARSLFTGALAGQWLVSVPDLFSSVLRREERHGSTMPVWFEPFGAGLTPMCAAFDIAGSLASGWAQSHPDSFPPIIINLTDGAATDGEPEKVQMWADRLRSLRTEDGNLLLFNVSVSSIAQTTTTFPAAESELSDEWARGLFRLSSELPPLMRTAAERLGVTTRAGARGFVSNATPDAIVLALTVGTQVAQADA